MQVVSTSVFVELTHSPIVVPWKVRTMFFHSLTSAAWTASSRSSCERP